MKSTSLRRLLSRTRSSMNLTFHSQQMPVMKSKRVPLVSMIAVPKRKPCLRSQKNWFRMPHRSQRQSMALQLKMNLRQFRQITLRPLKERESSCALSTIGSSTFHLSESSTETITRRQKCVVSTSNLPLQPWSVTTWSIMTLSGQQASSTLSFRMNLKVRLCP